MPIDMHVERRKKNAHSSRRIGKSRIAADVCAMLTTLPSAGDTTTPSPLGIRRSGSRKNAATAKVANPKAPLANFQPATAATLVKAAPVKISG